MTTSTAAPLIAYHGKQDVKEQYLARVRAHRAADEIIRGTYWEGGKGCAVGCTVHSNSHAAYETELGIPRILARLEDGIFEALPNGAALEWPERFLGAITPGADLSLVWPRFGRWLLVDPEDGVLRFARSARSKTSIQNVAILYDRWLSGAKPSELDWRGASAYAADADTAADYAAYAARQRARIKQADKLIELLEAAR
jgi:hypothetical protein